MLELKNLCSYYGHIQALDDVTIKVSPGEIICLIGANGAGKTTTLMSISGIVTPRSGEVRFLGEPVQRLRPEEIVALGICHVPEGRRIFPQMTVLENLAMGAFLRRDREVIRRDLSHMYDLFPILAERRHQLGGTLSGGEQQMLAIARALMSRPRLLLLDEPSLGLAPILVKLIFHVISKINEEEGTAILLVEQNANMALKIAHRGYVMENGRIVLEGIAEKLLDNEDVKRAYLGI